MADFISREATIKRIKEVYCVGCNSYHGVRCRACGTGDAIDMIEDAPAAERRMTMAEYIEREAISEEIRKYYYKNPPNSSYGEGFDRGLDRAQRAILDAPAADVATVRHGRWNDGDPYCPICRKDKFRGLDADIWSDWKPDYCPNCGAKMDGGDGNSDMA